MMFLSVVLVLAWSGLGAALPTGMPEEACEDMYPRHDTATPREDECPYYITTGDHGDHFDITLHGGVAPYDTFRGFAVRGEADGGVVGHFTFLDGTDYAQTRDCFGPEDTATHTWNDTKSSVTMEYWPDTADPNTVTLRASFVHRFYTFWVDYTLPLLS